MDKAKAKAITDRFAEAILAVEQEFGVKLAKSRGTYDSSMLKQTFEFHEVSIGSSGVNESSPQALDYHRFTKTFGLNVGMLGKPVKVKSGTYLFAGLNISRPKYMVALADGQGKDAGATTLKALPREFFVDEMAFLESRKGA